MIIPQEFSYLDLKPEAIKKTLLTSFIIVLSLGSYSSEYLISDPKPGVPKIILPGKAIEFGLNEFILLKPRDYKKITGRKLSVKEFLIFKMTQHWAKKEMKKKGIVIALLQDKDKKPFKWHWGGFFLGLLLPFGIGIIISALKKNEKKSDRVTSAAIGTAIISLVIIIAVLSSWSGNIL